MTREEAIEILNNTAFFGRSQENIDNAIDMAIEALKQEPITKNDLAVDCISREQAIEWVDNLRKMDECFGNHKGDYYPLSEVIDRLQNVPSATAQEPCNDCISREKALELAENSHRLAETMEDLAWLYENNLKALPSVQPKQEWIPVSERLPEPQANGGDKDLSEWVLVSLSTSKFDTVCGAFYCFSEKKWYRERVAFGTVTAWMPLPKPYKAESEGVDGNNDQRIS